MSESANEARRAYATHHGHRKLPDGRSSPTYNSWRAMILRCRNPRRADFKHYGARGVQVCPQWLPEKVGGTGGFDVFLADLGPRPEGKTLDRIDVMGHYEPSNCRWADKYEQRANQRPAAAIQASFEEDAGRWEPEDWAVEPKWPALIVEVARHSHSRFATQPDDGEEWPF